MQFSYSTTQVLKLVLLTIIVPLLLNSSCRKYEDGPGISFKQRSKRLFKSWEVEEVYVDGTDVTTQYMDLPDHYWHWTFDVNSIHDTTCRVWAKSGSYGESFEFSLLNEFENIRFNRTWMDTPANNPTWNGFDYHMVGNPYANWKITELKTKRLGLRTSVNGTTIELKFKNYIW